VQRNRRVSEEEESRLLAACDVLKEATPRARKLSWEAVRIMRSRVAAGEPQVVVAADYCIRTCADMSAE